MKKLKQIFSGSDKKNFRDKRHVGVFELETEATTKVPLSEIGTKSLLSRFVTKRLHKECRPYLLTELSSTSGCN